MTKLVNKNQTIELLYLQIILEQNVIKAFSSSRGEIRIPDGVDFTKILESDILRTYSMPAKLMIHIIGRIDPLSNDLRTKMLDDAKKLGYYVTRFEDQEQILKPEEAFGLLLIPFT
ncbi:MAG: hypothetical protein ACN4E2_03750 [Nitrospinota bacterium]